MQQPLLALFSARAGDSRLAEFEAVALRFGLGDVSWSWDDRIVAMHGGDHGPRLLQRLPRMAEDEQAVLADVAATCVACRGVFERWGYGDSIEDCAAVANSVSAEHVQRRVQGSWKLESLALGARQSQDARALGARMRNFDSVLDALELRPVDLEAAEHRIVLLEDRQLLHDRSPLPDPPPRFQLLFELPARVPAIHGRIRQLELPKRAFLSTSTLPADRALLLCNLALAHAPRASARVLDPYCGSGGLLLAAGALGARGVGTDIDWRLVSETPWPSGNRASTARPQRGAERVRMRDNFIEAGLEEPKSLFPLDVSATDAVAQWLRANDKRPYDAIVCDPPYGRREFQNGVAAWAGELSFRVDSATMAKTLGMLFLHAQQLLRPAGRLVFLVPVRSPRDAHKPSAEELRSMLRTLGPPRGLCVAHVGVEVIHRGLHRAVVVMQRT